jgi:carboxylesterase
MRATPAVQEGDREDGRPFDLPGGPDAALLIHGLTGSPFEVRYLAEALHRTGMRCVGPLLAGHGGDPRALGATSRIEWLAQAREVLRRLEGSRRTFVVGCSMGALVACRLAHEQPAAVDGLALLAPALRLAPAGRLAAALGRTALGSRIVVSKRAGSDVHDPEMRRANPCMDSIPFAAVAELEALASEVDQMLPGVAAPAIVVAGAQDHTVTLGGARRMARRLGSGPAELLVLPESYHLVGIDQERDRCAEAVLRFFGGIPVPVRGGGSTRRQGTEGGDQWPRT